MLSPALIQDPRESAAINLRRLFALRSIAIVGQIITVLVVRQVMEIDIPQTALAITIGIQLLFNAFTAWRVAKARHVRDPELFAQLLFDVLALTAMLYLTGGSTNPFTLLYLLPLTITAAALSGRYTWSMVAVTIACYTLLMFRYVPLPHMHHGTHGDDFDLHVLGMWLGFVLSAVLIAFFAVRMAKTLRSRDTALAELREQTLQNERVVALGTLAAGAAHELGTPLSTMAVMVKEISHEAPEALRTQLVVLREQIDRCKRILSTLSAAAGGTRAQSVQAVALDEFLEQLLESWRQMRPGMTVKTDFQGSRPAPRIAIEETLTQAILIILNNAGDVSPYDIDVIGHWDEQTLKLQIADRGPGLSPLAVASAGRHAFTTKPQDQGLGLGLFLAYTAVERLGGQVQLANRDGGGAVASISLPLAQLRVGA